MRFVLPLFVVYLFSFTSCEKEIEIDMPKHQPKAVINSIFKLNKPFFIYAHKSVGITEPQSEQVLNANIELYKDAVYLETLQFVDTCYQSNHLIEEEAIYKIIAKLPGLETVTATNYAPTPPTLVNAEFLGLISSSTWFDSYQISFEIEDDINKENFYLARVKVEYENAPVDDSGYPYLLDLYNEYDPILRAEENLFSDVLFNGNTQTIKANFEIEKGLTISNVKIILYAVTKEYFNFYKTKEEHIDSQVGDDFFGYIEPLAMYTNIEGGYGIFAGYSEVEFLLFDQTKK